MSSELTNYSCWNEAEEVPLFGGIQVVCDQNEDHICQDLGRQEEEDAQPPAEGVAPGPNVIKLFTDVI
jgi:uncharacterized protein YbdZ (MbtH family)